MGTYYDDYKAHNTDDIVIATARVLINRLTWLVKTSPAHYKFASKHASVFCSVQSKEILIELKTNTISDYLDEKNKLNKVKQTHVGTALDIIGALYMVYMGNYDTASIENPFERICISDLSREIENTILGNKESYFPQLSLDDLKYSHQKVMLYIQAKQFSETVACSSSPVESELRDIGKNTSKTTNMNTCDNLQYDQLEGILLCKGKQVKIAGKTYEGKLLSLFLPNGKPTNDKIHWNDIAKDISEEDITSSDISKLEEDKKKYRIYNTKRRINEKADYPLILSENGGFFLNPDLLKS